MTIAPCDRTLTTFQLRTFHGQTGRNRITSRLRTDRPEHGNVHSRLPHQQPFLYRHRCNTARVSRDRIDIFSADFFAPIVNQEQDDAADLLKARGNRWISDVLGNFRPNMDRSHGRSSVSFTHGGSLSGRTGRDGSDLVGNWHFWIGCLFRQQMPAGVGNSYGTRSTAQGSAKGSIGSGTSRSDCAGS